MPGVRDTVFERISSALIISTTVFNRTSLLVDNELQTYLGTVGSEDLIFLVIYGVSAA